MTELELLCECHKRHAADSARIEELETTITTVWRYLAGISTKVPEQFYPVVRDSLNCLEDACPNLFSK